MKIIAALLAMTMIAAIGAAIVRSVQPQPAAAEACMRLSCSPASQP